MSSCVKIEHIDVSAFTVPTSTPESDGTFEWDKTTLVLVEVFAGGTSGLGYSYADIATAQLIQRALAPSSKVTMPWELEAHGGRWWMQSAIWEGPESLPWPSQL